MVFFSILRLAVQTPVCVNPFYFLSFINFFMYQPIIITFDYYFEESGALLVYCNVGRIQNDIFVVNSFQLLALFEERGNIC